VQEMAILLTHIKQRCHSNVRALPHYVRKCLETVSVCKWLYKSSKALQSFVGPWPLFQFLDPIHSQWDSLDGNQPVARPLPIYRTKNTE
jgi:hypothetical protein